MVLTLMDGKEKIDGIVVGGRLYTQHDGDNSDGSSIFGGIFDDIIINSEPFPAELQEFTNENFWGLV